MGGSCGPGARLAAAPPAVEEVLAGPAFHWCLGAAVVAAVRTASLGIPPHHAAAVVAMS